MINVPLFDMFLITESTFPLVILHELPLINVFDVVCQCQLGVVTLRVRLERSEAAVQRHRLYLGQKQFTMWVSDLVGWL